jgi:hypothetical protein
MTLHRTVALLAIVAILLAAVTPGAPVLLLAIFLSGPLLPLALLAERRRETEGRRPRPFPFLSPLASRAPPRA